MVETESAYLRGKRIHWPEQLIGLAVAPLAVFVLANVLGGYAAVKIITIYGRDLYRYGSHRYHDWQAKKKAAIQEQG